MSIALIQSAIASGTSTAPACAFPFATTPGNLIIAKAAWLSAGGTFNIPAGFDQDASLTGSNPCAAIWSRSNATATTLVNALLSGSSARWILALEEWSGLLAATPVDRTASGTGSGASVASGTTAATTQANEMAAVAIAVDDGTPGDGLFSAPTNGYTLLGNKANGNPLALATLYKILSSTGTTSTAATCSTSPGFQGLIVTYKAPVSGTFTANYSAALNPGFQQRIRQAMQAQALAVIGESPTTANHVNRAVYAASVLRSLSDAQCDPIAQAVASDNATTNASNDTDLLARIAAIWNGLAGVV